MPLLAVGPQPPAQHLHARLAAGAARHERTRTLVQQRDRVFAFERRAAERGPHLAGLDERQHRSHLGETVRGIDAQRGRVEGDAGPVGHVLRMAAVQPGEGRAVALPAHQRAELLEPFEQREPLRVAGDAPVPGVAQAQGADPGSLRRRPGRGIERVEPGERVSLAAHEGDECRLGEPPRAPRRRLPAQGASEGEMSREAHERGPDVRRAPRAVAKSEGGEEERRPLVRCRVAGLSGEALREREPLAHEDRRPRVEERGEEPGVLATFLRTRRAACRRPQHLPGERLVRPWREEVSVELEGSRLHRRSARIRHRPRRREGRELANVPRDAIHEPLLLGGPGRLETRRA